MKISDAIMLGSTLIKPLAGVNLNESGTAGCAFGMVRAALEDDNAYKRLVRPISICKEGSVSLPCTCTGIVIGQLMFHVPASSIDSVAEAIVHLFNDHVMTRKDWTLEQLVDWVRTVEPADPEEKKPENAENEQYQPDEVVSQSK